MARMDAPPPERIGKYLVKEEIGRGGMGVVWRAYDPDLDREVAIKQVTILTDAEPSVLARFRHEARALARIVTPHVVAVYDSDLDASPPHLVLELVNGANLSRVQRDSGAFSPAKVADCAAQVLLGLSFAHRAGILHRDLKPSNLLLAAQGLVKIVDFGLAQMAADRDGEPLTGENEVVGTLRYLAPEVARGAHNSAASDLYSLGLTLVELAVGVHPHKGVKGTVLLHQVAYVPLPPVRELAPNLGADLSAWLDRMVAFSPESRFQSAAEALAALDRIRVEAPTVATAPARTSEPTTLARQVPARPSGVTSVTGTIRPSRGDQTGVTVTANRRLGLPFAVRLTLVLWLISSLAAAGAGFLIARHAIGVQLAKWRDELAATASMTALSIDPADQRAAAEGDLAAEARVFAALRRSIDVRPTIRFAYTMRRGPDTGDLGPLYFVVDASDEVDLNQNGIIESQEKRALNGDPYPTELVPRIHAGFKGPTADDEPTPDQWGSTLSGYAPIRDGDEVIGIVGVDVFEDHIVRMRTGIWRHMILLEGGILTAFLAAAWLIGNRIGRPVQRLLAAFAAASRGDRGVRAPVDGRDEFGELGQAFNTLQERIGENDRLREGLSRVLARSLGDAVASTEVAAGILVMDLGRVGSLDGTLTRTLTSLRGFGGVAEGVVGRGLVIRFPGSDALDRPGDRTLRAALALAGSGPTGLAIGVALANTGEDGKPAEDRARDLAAQAFAIGVDILADGAYAEIVSRHFFADHLRLADGREAYAIKGAIAAG